MINERPGLWADVLEATLAPETVATGTVLAHQMQNKDLVKLARTDINSDVTTGCPSRRWNARVLRAGGSHHARQGYEPQHLPAHALAGARHVRDRRRQVFGRELQQRGRGSDGSQAPSRPRSRTRRSVRSHPCSARSAGAAATARARPSRRRRRPRTSAAS